MPKSEDVISKTTNQKTFCTIPINFIRDKRAWATNFLDYLFERSDSTAPWVRPLSFEAARSQMRPTLTN